MDVYMVKSNANVHMIRRIMMQWSLDKLYFGMLTFYT